MSIFVEIERRNLDGIKVLLAEGTSLKIKDCYGQSPLYQAVQLGELVITETLLESGADPNWGGLAGIPLEAAASVGNTELVTALLEAGAKVDKKNEDGGTALISAAAGGHLSVVQLLVEAGAKVNILSKYGDFALLSAATNGHKNIFDYLSPLTSSKLLKQAEKRLREGVLARQREGDLPALDFIYAARDGDSLTVKKMIDVGINLNAKTPSGSTALDLAVEKGRINILRILIEAGVNLDVQDESGVTPLMVAILSFQVESTKVLLEAGANPNLQDQKGCTALVYAVEFNQEPDILQMLIQHKANLEIPTQNGYTPLKLALAKRQTNFVELLRMAGARE